MPTWAREVLDLLLPSRCLGCGDRIPLGGPEEPVCHTCRTRLRSPPWPRCARCHHPLGTGRVSTSCLACRAWSPALSWARSAVVLEDPADRLVHALKYQGWRELAPLMARAMTRIELPPPASSGSRLVVPVPTTRGRERRRGYNQADLIACAYAAELGLDVADALERRSAAASQVALHPSQRRSNVRRAFAPRPQLSPGVRERHVLLVDDVLTTGATASEAARTLERSGASGVTLVTFARALPDRRRRIGRS